MGENNGEYAIGEEDSRRLDVLKIWLTVMVLFIHSYTVEVEFADSSVTLQAPAWLDAVKYLLSHCVSECAVPGFFFISAVFLYKREFRWAENAKKKLRSLLVPYAALNTLWIAAYLVLQRISALRPYLPREVYDVAGWGFLQYLDAYLGFLNGYPIVDHLWFLRDLFILNLLSKGIKKLIDRFPKAAFALLAFIALLNPTKLILNGLVFFCLGYYFVKYSIKFADCRRIKAPVLITGYIAALALSYLARDSKIDYLPLFAANVLGLIFFFRFTTAIRGERAGRAIKFISRYRYPVYLFHEKALTLLKIGMVNAVPQTAFWQAALYFGVPAAVFALCVLLSALADRFLHRPYVFFVDGRSR